LSRLSSLARQRPPSPAVVVAAAATGGSGHARQIVTVCPRPRRPVAVAALAIPSTSVVQCRHNHCHPQAVFATAAATNFLLFGRSTFSYTEELVTSKSKAKECNLLFTAQLLGKLGFIPRLSASPGLDYHRSQKTKKNYDRHPVAIMMMEMPAAPGAVAVPSHLFCNFDGQ
jgi:hypothetical protein